MTKPVSTRLEVISTAETRATSVPRANIDPGESALDVVRLRGFEYLNGLQIVGRSHVRYDHGQRALFWVVPADIVFQPSVPFP